MTRDKDLFYEQIMKKSANVASIFIVNDFLSVFQLYLGQSFVNYLEQFNMKNTKKVIIIPAMLLAKIDVLSVYHVSI